MYIYIKSPPSSLEKINYKKKLYRNKILNVLSIWYSRLDHFQKIASLLKKNGGRPYEIIRPYFLIFLSFILNYEAYSISTLTLKISIKCKDCSQLCIQLIKYTAISES